MGRPYPSRSVGVGVGVEGGIRGVGVAPTIVGPATGRQTHLSILTPASGGATAEFGRRVLVTVLGAVGAGVAHPGLGSARDVVGLAAQEAVLLTGRFERRTHLFQP